MLAEENAVFVVDGAIGEFDARVKEFILILTRATLFEDAGDLDKLFSILVQLVAGHINVARARYINGSFVEIGPFGIVQDTGYGG